MTLAIAIVGLGKIARDQHVPELARSTSFTLAGVASPHDTLAGVPNFPDLDALLASGLKVDAVAICTTPQVRSAIARRALDAGLHVLLEKPPGVTVSEVLELTELAARRGVTLFASWHSRHGAAVEAARAWLTGRKIQRALVIWKEDVRVWHPGQRWIWQPGGLGVFDPGINALSILTRIFPAALYVEHAYMKVPSNCATPIAATLALRTAGAPIDMELDFRHTSRPTWDITVDTDDGKVVLSQGGKTMSADDLAVALPEGTEYAQVYAHFAELIAGGRSDVDVTPLQLVADAFLCGRHVTEDPFED